MKSWILWEWLLLLMIPLNATEFLYPVALHRDGLLYLIYQKTPHHIELWEWNTHTSHAEQLLFSRFTPAGFQLLPTQDGFSFIDNGILKIKKFFKRSPKSIEFDAPVYQVELVNWITDTICYASGKYQNNFGIYQIDDEGEVIPLCVKESVDCMYPQKIDDALFYIERDDQWHCRLMQTSYVPAPGNDFQERLAWHYTKHQSFTPLVSFTTPVIFLKMISSHEGFVIGHPPVVNKTDQLISFDYYHIEKKASAWHATVLFSFSVPTYLLFIGSTSRLYESMLPLVPRHEGDHIIFMHATELNLPHFSLFTYNTITKEIQELPQTQGLFPPLNGMSGGELAGTVMMGVSENKDVKIALANIVP